ncbi:ATP-binding protein [Rhizobium sp. Root483D2]|uniref:ATP-binding protein n=1 Tax=Rhizobium sp. Root483D2 TaxID=1736545 RepID=UPI000713363B|nr:ATP-binding protein [Rhizobium sp. Root483D2]KQY39973.1 hypothetical protein ASD32_16335 [Rhizobium sp. Root483D2]
MIHDPAKLIRTLISRPRETEWLEFKVGNFNPESVGKYVSGLANSAIFAGENKAYFILGIEDDTHQIVGTNIKIDEERVGKDTFLFWLNGRLTPQINIEHASVDFDGKTVQILCIDPSYQHPVKFNGDAYIRIDTSLQQLARHPERERAVWQATSRFAFEQGIARSHATIDAIYDHFEVHKLLTALGVARPNVALAADRMVAEDLILDNQQGGFDVTNLMVLAAAKDMRSFSGFSRKGVRVITYAGKSKLNSKSDAEGKKGYAVSFGPLLAYIMDKIPHREQLQHGLRVKVYDIPEVAVREILANAIIHQDFTARGDGPVVEIYPDKVKIINPGKPLIPTDRFIDSPSRSRNDRFGHLMRRIGICEERGSGIDRALTEIEKNVLPAPIFQEIEDTTVVTLFKSRDFADMTRDDRVRACYQHACLGWEKNDYMSNGSLRKRLGLTDKQYPLISIVIADARDAKLIRPLDEDQANRNARYVPYWA